MASNQKKKTKAKLAEEVDRISSLPDPIIHHILSFLPSTLYAVRTCVLSKRWRYQWTRVPVLIFDYRIPNAHFSTFVDSVLILHDSPTITTFVIDTRNLVSCRLLLPVWIRFAMRKQVKELTLDFGDDDKFKLPRFFFDNDSLVKFKAVRLDFSSCGQVKWPSLKVFSVKFCDGVDKAIGRIVSGSIALEFLQFFQCDWCDPVVIASNSLKRLVLKQADELGERPALEISCPNLEELELLYTFMFESFKLVDLPSSARVSFDLYEIHLEYLEEDLEECDENKVLEILLSVKGVHALSIGSCFLKVFSLWVVARSLSSPLMNTKCLTLNISDFGRSLPGIICLLRNSSVLEKLIINFDSHFQGSEYKRVFGLYDFGEKYWNSQENALDFSMLHLKTIEIFSLTSNKDQYSLLIKFLEFFLRNSKILEDMALFESGTPTFYSCSCEQKFSIEFQQQLSLNHKLDRVNEFAESFKTLWSISRCSADAVISVSCCKGYAIDRKKG